MPARCCRSCGAGAGVLSTIHGGVLAFPIVNENLNSIANEKFTRKNTIFTETETFTPTLNSSTTARYASIVRVTEAYAVTLTSAFTTTQSTVPYSLPTMDAVPWIQ